MNKKAFIESFRDFLSNLESKICQPNHQWKIKGFIDSDTHIFSLSNDTKVISKILEIHIFPYILEFAKTHHFNVVLPYHQIIILIYRLYPKKILLLNMRLI